MRFTALVSFVVAVAAAAPSAFEPPDAPEHVWLAVWGCALIGLSIAAKARLKGGLPRTFDDQRGVVSARDRAPIKPLTGAA